jgi:hypothetical protein
MYNHEWEVRWSEKTPHNRESIQKSCVRPALAGLMLPMIDNWCALSGT